MTSDPNEPLHTDKSQFSLDFLLVALNLALDEPAQFRSEGLLEVARRGGSDGNSDVIPVSRVHRLVDCLIRSCQLPAEKLVQDSDDRVPYQRHRQASAQEMLERGLKELKQEGGAQQMSVDTFYALLTSNSICAWGECYRAKK